MKQTIYFCINYKNKFLKFSLLIIFIFIKISQKESYKLFEIKKSKIMVIFQSCDSLREHHRLHCNNCINVNTCNSKTFCKLVSCSNQCGHIFHECKASEHLAETCQNSLVDCLNLEYGCKRKIKRSELTSHLASCVASVVLCCHWNYRICYLPNPDPDYLDKSEILTDPLRIKNELNKTTNCDSNLRRDEYADHYAFVHNILIPQFDWIYSVCPFSCTGCKYLDKKFNFILSNSIADAIKTDNFATELAFNKSCKSLSLSLIIGQEKDYENSLFMQLPVEILSSIISHLDSVSFLNLSRTSKV